MRERKGRKKENLFKNDITLILTSAASSSLEQYLSPFDLNLEEGCEKKERNGTERERKKEKTCVLSIPKDHRVKDSCETPLKKHLYPPASQPGKKWSGVRKG